MLLFNFNRAVRRRPNFQNAMLKKIWLTARWQRREAHYIHFNDYILQKQITYTAFAVICFALILICAQNTLRVTCCGRTKFAPTLFTVT